MSCSIKFVRLDDFAADIDVLDLSANGYSLAVDGYFPVAAPDDVASVREVITLKLQGTSKDDLAAMTQDIDEKVKQVGWWLKDPGVERYQVWIRVQLENESLPRQAQIISIMPPDKVRVFTLEEKNDNYIGEYSIGIERTPFWEDPYPYPTTTGKNGLSVTGGMVQLSETINGDVSARALRITGANNNTAHWISSWWIGWKTSRFGTAANFLPVWELHNGTEVDTDTSETADASAYDGTRVTTSFATVATLILRQSVEIADMVSAHSINAADQRGTYTVLLRAKMSDASVARVQMKAGLVSAGVFSSPIYRSRQVVSGTLWRLYELGTVKIPPSRLPLSYTLVNYGIGILAERLSGAGSLYMDCLILIPIDDGALKLESTNSVKSGNLIEGFQAADDSLYATVVRSGASIFSVVPKPQNKWGIPALGEKPYMVIAVDDLSSGNVKNGTIDVTYEYIPRWRTLRGNIT